MAEVLARDALTYAQCNKTFITAITLLTQECGRSWPTRKNPTNKIVFTIFGFPAQTGEEMFDLRAHTQQQVVKIQIIGFYKGTQPIK